MAIEIEIETEDHRDSAERLLNEPGPYPSNVYVAQVHATLAVADRLEKLGKTLESILDAGFINLVEATGGAVTFGGDEIARGR